jgi:hypothetical protein
MGNRWFGKKWISNFNAPHKDSVGWIDGNISIVDSKIAEMRLVFVC